MNIIILDNWLKEYLKTDATCEQIAHCLSLCGPSVERVFKINGQYAYDIEITTNRIDTASVIGIAREAAAILPQFGIKAKFRPPMLEEKKFKFAKRLSINISDPDKLCQRVLGVVLDKVKLGPSPKMIKERLEAAGIRSLNNVVDVTNYIMTEIGHPAHVFDYDRITSKKLVIRQAKKRETIISLEDKKYYLPGGDIVIDDGIGKIIDLPGIIGTANSVVTDKTHRILLFIETNNPVQIRKSSMQLGIRTVAATYNEKGVDPNLAKTAILRGIQLLQKLTKAQLASKIYDLNFVPAKPKVITLPCSLINRYMGIAINKNKISQILNSLGFSDQYHQVKQEFKVVVPSWRNSDINIPEDLVEEISRIYGYHNLASQLPDGQLPLSPTNQIFDLEEKIKCFLVNRGFTETYTYSMQSKNQLEKCFLETKQHLKISNPLTEEWLYLRQSLIPSLLSILESNPKQPDIKIFELANKYLPQPKNLPKEQLSLCLALSNDNKNNFFILKGITELLLNSIGISNIKYSPLKDNLFFGPKAAQIYHLERKIGIIGELNFKILDNFNLENKVIILDLYFSFIAHETKSRKIYHSLASYPPIIEDLTLILKPKVLYQELIQLIKQSNCLIKKIDYVGLYKNNLTIRITYQDQKRNLTNEEIAPIRKKIAQKLMEKDWATLKEKGWGLSKE